MAEVLVPYTEFSDVGLANDLHGIAERNKRYLERRGHYGFLKRYGGSLALESVQRGQRQDQEAGKPAHLAVVQTVAEGAIYKRQVIGTASIQEGLPLYKIRDLGILTPPPVIAERTGLRERFEHPYPGHTLSHNVGVIIDRTQEIKGSTDALAYQQVVQKVVAESPEATAWMLLPEDERITQPERRRVIDAGLARLDTARFDDLESAKHVPPVSGLFVSVK